MIAEESLSFLLLAGVTVGLVLATAGPHSQEPGSPKPIGSHVYQSVVDMNANSSFSVPVFTFPGQRGAFLVLTGSSGSTSVPDHSHGDHAHNFRGLDYHQGYYLDLSVAWTFDSWAPDFVLPQQVGAGPPTVQAGTCPSGVRVWLDGVDMTAQLGGPWGTGGTFSTQEIPLSHLLNRVGRHELEVSTQAGGRLTYTLFMG